MPLDVVTVLSGRITLPGSLSAALGAPRRLWVVPQEEGFSVSAVAPPDYAKNAAKRLLRRGTVRAAAKQVGAREYVASIPVDDGVYGVAAHPPWYYALPLEGTERESRERFWETIVEYHEHRPVAEQDEAAKFATEWFVRDVLVPTGGQSFLELGCGAGRNLAVLARHGYVLHAVERNPGAVAEVRRTLPKVAVVEGSLYDLTAWGDKSIDVVYTTGVLMHVPHDEVEKVIQEMTRIASVAVAHVELHGQEQPFDFHRYPRDYEALYRRLGLDADYTVYPQGHERADANGAMGVLIHRR